MEVAKGSDSAAERRRRLRTIRIGWKSAHDFIPPVKRLFFSVSPTNPCQKQDREGPKTNLGQI